MGSVSRKDRCKEPKSNAPMLEEAGKASERDQKKWGRLIPKRPQLATPSEVKDEMNRYAFHI